MRLWTKRRSNINWLKLNLKRKCGHLVFRSISVTSIAFQPESAMHKWREGWELKTWYCRCKVAWICWSKPFLRSWILYMPCAVQCERTFKIVIFRMDKGVHFKAKKGEPRMILIMAECSSWWLSSVMGLSQSSQNTCNDLLVVLSQVSCVNFYGQIPSRSLAGHQASGGLGSSLDLTSQNSS